MPGVQPKVATRDNDIIAYLISDLHLSHRPPLARSGEKDWYEVQKRYLNQIKLTACFKMAPIICAGDIFDDGWRSNRCPPELINFAISNLPRMYAVPGQHDLPHHRLEALKRSAFWTLVEAGVVTYLEPGRPCHIENLILHGFPWGVPVVPNTLPPSTWGLHVAVIHQCIWTKRTGFTGARKEDSYLQTLPKLEGYDVAVFGDNHKHFRKGKVWNCGGFIRRTIIEKDHNPCMGLLQFDGQIKTSWLNTDKDKFIDTAKAGEELLELTENFTRGLMDILSLIEEGSVDFIQKLKYALASPKIKDSVKAILTKALGDK